MAPETLSARALLDAEREHLEEQLARFDDDGALDSYDENFADSGQVTAERGEVEALTGRLREQLDEVRHALAKVDAGTYGRCESCEEQIPPARLEAVPTARLCIRCASAAR